MAGPLLACRRRRARTLKRVACGKIKVPTEREFFVRRYSLMRHPIGRGGDATVIATLPNPPAEIIDAYSRKLSSESMKNRSSSRFTARLCIRSNRKEAHVQDAEGFAVIWRNAQRARSELLGSWLVRLVSRLSTLSHEDWFKLGAPVLRSAKRERSTQAG